MALTIHCDGASRGNPGEAASGFVVLEDGKELFKQGRSLGKQTNNFAEYSAVIDALNWLSKNNKTDQQINFILDSQLVVNQLLGIYKIKNKELLKLAALAKSLEALFLHKVKYQSVPREKNKIADSLVNEILDSLASNNRQ